jgi:hypothetical protein
MSDERVVKLALWRRLDQPGHDACRWERGPGGHKLEGTAVFRHASGPVVLEYRVDCDASWRTRAGSVRGFIGKRRVDLQIALGDDGWTLDGRPVAGLDGLVDLDFGFTPATNSSQVERVALTVGSAAEVPVAWLDDECTGLTCLPQRYVRTSQYRYAYEAPTVGYAEELERDPSGFVRSYPKLWLLES